jgi:uncharacterized protein with PQ loop repeat
MIELSEWIGYLASFIVAVSFTLRNVKKLRVINSLGAFVFIVYGFLIDSNPVIITNTFILFFNLYYIFKKDDK